VKEKNARMEACHDIVSAVLKQLKADITSLQQSRNSPVMTRHAVKKAVTHRCQRKLVTATSRVLTLVTFLFAS